LKAKVLTVSDGVIAGTREDRSGAALVARLAEAGYEVVDRRAVADGVDNVAHVLRELTAGFAGLVVTSATDYWARFRRTPGPSRRSPPAKAG